MFRVKFSSSGSVIDRIAPGDRLPVFGVAIAIAALPLLKPKGPGHMAPVDVIIGAASRLVLVWAASVRTRVRVPYAVPVAVLIIGGAIGGIAGASPNRALVALFQDVFLLAWCAAIATVARTPGALRALLATWAWSSAVWASILVGAAAVHIRAISGIASADGGRARFTFDHPNLAASYFVVSLFVVVLARRPRNPVLRAGAILALLAAIVLAGSNAAFIGLGAGAVVAAAVGASRRFDPLAGVAVFAGACLAAVAMAHLVSISGTAAAVERSDNPYVRYGPARGDRSLRDRVDLFRTELALFQQEPLLGRGPSSTRDSLDELGQGRAKEAHNDYLASLVERGPIGAAGLIFLIVAVGVRLAGTGPRSLSPRWARAAPGSAALAGVAAVLIVSAATHEILHYRHVWALFGLLAALHAWGRSPEPVEGGRA